MDTKILKANPDGFAIASEILKSGGLVAFPTETVYGLGADAFNTKAVAKIYSAKKRPNFNPLIVHVIDLETAQKFVYLDDAALLLANNFWPGPLTIVAPIRAGSNLSELITAGLDTIAIHQPFKTWELIASDNFAIKSDLDQLWIRLNSELKTRSKKVIQS